jgi:hypothetical protein
VTCVKKLLWFFIISIICVVILRYSPPDFSWFAEAFGDDSSNIADLNQPMPHAVLPAIDEGWVDMESYKGKVVLISGFNANYVGITLALDWSASISRLRWFGEPF